MNLLNEFFEEVSSRDLWQIKSPAKKSEILVEIGDVSQEIFFIKSGAAIVATEIECKEQIIRLGYKGSILTAIDSFLNEKPTKYQLKIIRDSEIMITNKVSLQKIFEGKPELFNGLLTELLHQQLERELDILHSKANDRFARLLKRSPQIFQEIPHKYIASYLRISPETLSRLLKS